MHILQIFYGILPIWFFMFDNDELYQFQVGGGYKTCEMLRKPIETCSKQRTYPSAVSNTVRSLIGNHQGLINGLSTYLP